MRTGLWLVLPCGLLWAQPQACSFERAVQLQQSGQDADAVRAYEVCIAAQPDRVEYRSNLGAVYAKLGRYAEAIDQYKSALTNAPAAVAPRLRFNLALAYYKSFQIPEAAAEFEKLRASQPSDLNIGLLLADCRLRTGEFRQAIDLLLPLEASHPDQPALDYVLGMALIRDGRIAEGQVRVNRILGRGESAEGHLLLGTALFSANSYPEAIKEFAKADALNPDLPGLHSYYGQALLFTGDADGAAQAFRKELAVNANDFDASFQLAQILQHRGDTAAAKPLLDKAAQLRPGQSGAGFSLRGASAPPVGPSVGALAPPIPGIELSKPLVLVFGSYTCPKLRSSAADLKRISDQYRGRVEFRLVYIREAHSGAEWQSTINDREGVALAPARNLDEKREHAGLCLRKLNLSWPAVVDGMDGPAEKAYDAWPSRVYVIGRDGRIAFNSALGELDFRPADLESALREMLSK